MNESGDYNKKQDVKGNETIVKLKVKRGEELKKMKGRKQLSWVVFSGNVEK